MTAWLKAEIACITLLGSLFACAQAISLDFSRLSSLYRQPLLTAQKRGEMCMANPCEASEPFLCRDARKCVALKFVCDGTWDCDDGFDEEPAVCFAASRPSYDDLYYFIENEATWMVPKFFNGASIDLVAHALTDELMKYWHKGRHSKRAMAADMEDLRDQIGMTDDNMHNLRLAFEGAMEGDERELLKMGMPDRSWHEVQYVLQKLLDSGFKV